MNKNNEVNLYIENWVPTLNDHEHVKQVFKDIKNFYQFNWIIEINVVSDLQLCPYIDAEALRTQMLTFINKFKNKKINIILDGFSQLIFFSIYDQVKHMINKIILLNPLDELFYLRLASIKGRLLPTNNIDALHKYIYLFHHFNNCGNLDKRIMLMRKEVKAFSDLKLLYHKLFDQLLKAIYIKQYFNWIKNIDIETYVIVGEFNPLINHKQHKKMFNNISKNYYVINDCGYCLLWEKQETLLSLIKKIIN